MTKRYPKYYFLILFLLFVLAFAFWSMAIRYYNTTRGRYDEAKLSDGDASNWNQAYLPDEIGKLIPIDSSKLIIDSTGRRSIVSNLVNIALKNSTLSIAVFARDLKATYPSDDYKIIYIDSVINRLQIQLPERERPRFKADVKISLSKYPLLVWDEVLFGRSIAFNDPMLKDVKASWYLKAVNAKRAWETSTGDKNIIIAVVDNGFDLAHPELAQKAVKPYNVIDKSEDVGVSSKNHGTHITSTIAGNGNNGQGLLGLCPDCPFMPIKVEDRNGLITNSYVIDGILYAIKNNASVINLSMGMQIPNGINLPLPMQKDFIQSGAKDEEAFWEELFRYADEHNVTCVLAAGNSNMMTGFDPFQRVEGTIKVGAIDENFQKAPFSNFGDKTTLFAPGTEIIGASPKNGYEALSGTSMAAPIVSGFVGLIKSKNKGIRNKEILKILNANTIQRYNMRILNIVSYID